MSWNINVYVEKKSKDSDKWEYVNCVSDYFKCNLDGTSVHEWNTFDCIAFNDISDSLKEHFNNDGEYFDAKVVSLKDMNEYANKMIERAVNIKKTLWIALGLPEYTDDEYADIEDPDKYDEDGKLNAAWNPMTFPVNKKLFEQLQEADFGFAKGYKIHGMTDAAEAMCHFDDKIRFILVGS